MESSTNITVVTSITGGKDSLINEQVKGNANWVAYLDTPEVSDTWTVKTACDKFKDPRRNSRPPKILIHKYCNTEYSIWIDGSIQMNVTPEFLIDKYLKDCDIAVSKHPLRDCVYEEATVCAKTKLDDPEVIIEQVKCYEDDGYAKHKGLAECAIILRRHTPEVEAFNNAWWAEYTRFSRRDQISFPYAVDRVGIRVNYIEDYFYTLDHESAMKKSGEFKIVTHKHYKTNENIN
jgi:hypothetical protein